MENFISKKANLVSEVLESFNIEGITEYMKKTNWTWAFPYEETLRVPTFEEIYDNARRLLYDVLYTNSNMEDYWLETGGLRAHKDSNYNLWIEFITKY